MASTSTYFELWDLEKLIWEIGAFVLKDFAAQGESVIFYCRDKLEQQQKSGLSKDGVNLHTKQKTEMSVRKMNKNEESQPGPRQKSR